MRILYVSHYFPPETNAPAVRVHELSREWVRAGHDVTVLTGFPNHPTGRVFPGYRARIWRGASRETVDGIHVLRVWLAPLANRRNLERVVNYGSFCLSASLAGQFMRDHDVVIATSPQLLVGLAGVLVAGRRMPLVFEVRDLWPESLISLEKTDKTTFFYRTLDRLADHIYRRSSLVVAVSQAIGHYLVERKGFPAEKVRVVENGVDPNMFCPAPADPQWRTRLERGRQIVLSYIGTLGNASYLWTLLDAAKSLQETHPEVSIALVGEGAEHEGLEAKARADGLDNVSFHGAHPREKVPKIISASDLCLVVLRRDEVFKTVIPSKMLEFMACGRPVLLGVDGQARQILEAANAGMFVEPQNPDALAAAVQQMIGRRSEWGSWGRNGSEYIRQHFSRQRKAEEYIEVLQELVGRDGKSGQ